MWLRQSIFLFICAFNPYKKQTQWHPSKRYNWIHPAGQASTITQKQIDIINVSQLILQSNISNADEMELNDCFFRINSEDKNERKSAYNDMESQYQDNATVSSEYGGSDGRKRKFRGVNGRQYVSKRIYMCGCLEAFGFVEQLAIHVDKSHQAKIPDGSIYGIKKQALMKFFHIPYTRPQSNPNRRIYLFKCGCGRQYSCSSSLYYHIKTVHQGSQPVGTVVGVPKNRQ